MRSIHHVIAALAVGSAACSDPTPNAVRVTLAPDTVSSIDGTLTVHATALDDAQPLDDQPVQLSIAYADRNGVDHASDPITAVTDVRGEVTATFTGLAWEGTGTVTAAALDDGGAVRTIDGLPVAATATFAVLDRTPPAIEILPPTVDARIGPGLPLEVQVHVTDEIGVSQLVLEADGELVTSRSTTVASGALDDTITFRLDVPLDALPGPTITLYALAGDLSSNEAAATPLVLTVDPAIAVATPPGLTGAMLTDGTDADLGDPRALALSPMDGQLYVADNAQTGACQGGCVRKVDPATGAVDAAVVAVINGTAEGIAFDATGDNLFVADRQNRLVRLTWNGTAYATPTTCNNPGAQSPRQPFHLVSDATLGVLVVDDDSGDVLREAGCTGASPTTLSQGSFDRPRGIALGPDGEIYVADNGTDEIALVDRADGAVSNFESHRLDRPYGLAWLAGGSSAFADSLVIADNGDREVVASTGDGPAPIAFLRNPPIDVEVVGTTLYVLTQPSSGDRGRIFVVDGL